MAEARQAAAQQLAADAVVLVGRVDADVLDEGDRDPVGDDARCTDQRGPVPGRDHVGRVVQQVGQPPVEARHLLRAPEGGEEVRHLLVRDRPTLADRHLGHGGPLG